MWGISYWILPIISGCTWVGMLIAMFVVWAAEGKPHYVSEDPGQTIPYISDIGASGIKPLFIAGACVTTVFLDLSFLSERWLRHKGRLAKNTTRAEHILVILSIVFAIFGTCGLILLTIFDTVQYPTVHDCMLLVFIAGYIISAIFICTEYQRLGIHFRQHRVLRMSFWIKLTFIFVEAALAIAFAVTNFKGATNAAAVLEWSVSFIFTFYVLSFFIDLIPAVHTKRMTSRATAMEMEENDALSNTQGYPNGATDDQIANEAGATAGRTYGNGNSAQNGFVANGVHYGNGTNGVEQSKENLAHNF